MSPLLLRVPLQAKHPYGSEVEDFVIDIEMREGRLMRRDPIRPARRPPSETPEVDDLWVEEGRRLPWGLFFWGLVALCGTVIVISFLLSLS